MNQHLPTRTDTLHQLNLYLHFPFCRSKCHYCGFFSQVDKGQEIPAYVNALRQEIINSSRLADRYRVCTIYFGGGTPSLLSSETIKEIIKSICKYFIVEKEAEITLEANPESLTERKLAGYFKAGINRLSLGLQAWQDELLTYLGRGSMQKDFIDAFKSARAIGFRNINVDLIFAIPNQTLNQWQTTLKKVTALEPEHISCYSLELDNSSVIGKLHSQGKFKTTDEVLDREMYVLAKEMLKDSGYHHYEISNFSKAGYECKHNLSFWQYQPYLGLGAGAHSFFKDKRFSNICNVHQYIEESLSGKLAFNSGKLINNRQQISEAIMLGLRLISGLDIKQFKQRFGKNIFTLYGQNLRLLIQAELIKYDGNVLKLTNKGIDLSNQVAMTLI
ncbi:MAG: radical SAM family heme chaperone HemW [Patescibacteria group bacterium]|jgi:oxygen-independent coproporphyrinogen-3 oxidase